MSDPRGSNFRLHALVAALAALPAGSLLAQDAATPAATEPQRIVITGSNIKRIDTEGVLPVQVITAEDIRRTGYSTVTDVLRSLPASAAGGLSDSNGSASFSTGASSISLRGLGSQATLVLLNGRRIAPFAPADPNFGQASAVNIDALPLEVIERIEILRDGASAIYGSEAIAGVVNVITRQEYQGGLASLSATANDRGNYRSQNAALTFGFGDFGADRFNVFASAEFEHRTRTGFRDVDDWLIDQRFANSPIYRTGQSLFSSYSPSGNYYDAVFDPATQGSAIYYAFREPAPGCPASQIDANGACRFDIWPYADIIPKSDRFNLFVRGTAAFTPELTGFAEVAYNRTKTRFSGPPQIYGDFGSWFASATGQVVNVPEVLPPGHPNNPTGDYIGYRHRFTEVGPTDNTVDSDALRVVAGLQGSAGGWDYEGAFTYSVNNFESTNLNQIRRSVLTEGIQNGTYNFLDPSAGAISPDDLRIDSTDKAKSSYTGIDFKGSRELTKLGGGPLAIAIGGEYRREKRSTTPDVNKETGEVVGFGNAAADGSRNVQTLYSELSIPFVKNVEVQLAGRVDHYSDYGTSTNPKVAASWKIAPTFSVRGSYETGFRAPSLTEIAKSDVAAFSTVTDPKRCIDGDEDDCALSIGVLIASNPNLKPEKSRGINVGFVWEPAPAFSTSIDYFQIKRRNEVDTLSETEILANEDSSDPRYAGRVKRGPPDPGNPDQPGRIQSITTGYFNLGTTEVAGLDIDARLKSRIGEWGALSLLGQFTYYTKYEQSSAPGEPMIDYLGYFNQPRMRGSLSFIWDYNDFSTALTGNFVSGYKTYNPKEVDEEQCDGALLVGICDVGAWQTFDLALAYNGFRNLGLSLVVKNLADRKPPVDPNFYFGPYFNNDFHNPTGRLYTLSATYKF